MFFDKNFWIRFRSSIGLLIVTVASLLLGGNVLFAIIVAVSLIGMKELYQVIHMERTVLAFVGYIACISYYALLWMKKSEMLFPFFILFLLVLMAVYVFSFPKHRTDQVTLAFFGFFYVAILLSFIYRVRMIEGGKYLVWLSFIGSWGSDTCAYLVGRAIGKRKMAPILSPKKSVEGLFGGIVGAALIGVLFAVVIGTHIEGIQNPKLAFAVIGACCAMISTVGDLAASAIKRNYEVKDYGNLIPGHGGILDRFDSVIFTAPIVFYLAQIWQRI